MHRIDTVTAQKDKFGAGKNGFTRGNPQTGTPATDLDDDYFDMLQEELCAVVEESGEELDKGKHNQLLTALRSLLLSRSNPFGDIASDGPEAIATALANLQLGEAAKRDVGDSENQIPDMSYFTKSTAGGAAIVFTLPGGMIIQCGNIGTLAAGASVTVTYPIPFPLAMGFVIPAAAVSADSTTPVALAIDATVVNSRTGIVFRNCSTRLNLGTRYLAIGY